MASAAGQMPRRLSLIDFGAFVHSAVRALSGVGSLGDLVHCGDDVAARSVALTGLAALFGLPTLMLASIAFGAPLAAPAAIALGYLAMSYALSSRLPRSASAINALVLLGLVACSLSFLQRGEGPARAALAAALLAPFFAAAPAVARIAVAPRSDAASSAALRSAACLDRLAPSEAVLIVRRDGTLLAATRAAEECLRLPAAATGRDVSRCFGIVDRPKLSHAIVRCRPSEKVELTLHGENGGGSTGRTAEVSAIEGGAISIRLRAVAADVTSHTVTEPVLLNDLVSQPEIETHAICDVGEAITFASRHGEANALAKRALVTSEIEDGIWARCERQVCRRIVLLMIDAGLTRSGTGDRLHLTGRTLKSVVLLRLVVSPQPGNEHLTTDAEARGNLAALRKAVEEAGGTLFVDGAAAEPRLSVRLNSAAAPLVETKG